MLTFPSQRRRPSLWVCLWLAAVCSTPFACGRIGYESIDRSGTSSATEGQDNDAPVAGSGVSTPLETVPGPLFEQVFFTGPASGDEDLTDFTLFVVREGDEAMASTARVGGALGVHLAGNTAALPVEVQRLDSDTGYAEFWVRVPTLRHDAPTELVLTLGTLDRASLPAASDVWNDYNDVYHFEEVGQGLVGEYRNSAGGTGGTGGDGQADRTPQRVPGPLGFGQRFDGGDDFIALAASGGITGSQGTLSHWLQPESDNFRVAYYEKAGSGELDGFGSGSSETLERHSAVEPTNEAFFLWQERPADGIDNQQRVKSPMLGRQHVVITWSLTGHMRLYLNGTHIQAHTMADRNLGEMSADYRVLGRPHTDLAAHHWHGTVDELRVGRRALPGAFIATEFANQSSPSTFIVWGPLEQR